MVYTMTYLVTSVLALALVWVVWLSPASAVIDEKPKDAPLEYYILEELPANTLIGNVIIDAGLNKKYDKLTVKMLMFSFLNQPDRKQDLFAIQDNTGIVRTTHRIDRDTICPGQVTCIVWLHVAVQPPQYFEVIKIIVDILDINDHKPTFPQKSLDLQVLESVSIGSTFALPTASDPDSSSYSIQGYELQSPTDKFQLHVSQNTFDGSTDLKLELVKKLDRERESFYKLIVVAHDGARPAKSGSIVVNITVEDTNDNHPRFANSSYEVFVRENTQRGAIVTKLLAVDNDHGKNGEIVYSFSTKTEKLHGEMFGIDNHTGEVYLKADLDYEDGSIYLLTVLARDKGTDSKNVQTTVVIRVEDMNDNTPHITVNTLTTTEVAEISESAVIGTFVAHVSVSDSDSGLNGKVVCRIDHDVFDIQLIYLDQYKIVTKSHLDRELESIYSLVITCTDNGLIPNYVAQNVTVKVIDDNDNIPVFLQKLYHAEVKENNFVDEFIAAVSATDKDIEENGEVRYKMHTDSGGLFNVHPITGLITTNAIFDYEQLQQLNFRVLAYDLGTPSQTGTTTVRLAILNTNDEAPKFSQFNYAFGTFENQPSGTEVGTVAAVDADEDGDSTHLHYIFHNPSQHVKERFNINVTSGKILTKVALDREDRPSYHMVVMATSNTFPPMTSSVSVTVYVADQNDNTPVIIYPREHKNTVNVSNLVPVSFTIAKVEAKDDDIGLNAKLTYKLTNGNERGLFEIHEETGDITIFKPLVDVGAQLFVLQIQVQDNGYLKKSSIAVLRVKVTRANALRLSNFNRITTNKKNTMLTVVILTSLSVILIFILVAAIVIIWRKGANRNAVDKYTPYTRQESQQMLKTTHAKDDTRIENNLDIMTGKEQCGKDTCTDTTNYVVEDSVSRDTKQSTKGGAFVINVEEESLPSVHMLNLVKVRYTLEI